MMRAVLLGLVAAVFGMSLAMAEAADGDATYDLLFKEGTLDAISRDVALVYRRDVSNALKPDTEERDTGDIALSFHKDRVGMAKLVFRQDEKKRSLGVFPASVGNPMIMYFYESVIRDMAESAGGSPFYIRNRVKESLVQPSDVEPGEAIVDGETVATQTIRMQPFAEDPNRDRMQGFGNLELTVTMSEAVPGWYVSLVAESRTDGQSVYRSEMQFDRLEAEQ